MFDINLYTRLVIAANQYKDLNFITKDDLYDFIELDDDFKTGIVDHNLDIENLDPDEYADTYASWTAEAATRYENMRSEYLMQDQIKSDEQ